MVELKLHLLPNSERFEHLICDLFNKLENEDCYTNNIDFQRFEVMGQEQK